VGSPATGPGLVTVIAMARPALIAVGIGAALVAGAAVVVLAEGPQSAIPLAVDQPPPTTAAPAPVTPEPTPNEPAQPAPTDIPPPVPGELISNGPRDIPKVAITFDTAFAADTAALTNAGIFPPQYNEAVVNYLAAEKIPATVFVTGLWAEQYPQAMERMAGIDTFEFGNHTWSHAGWTDDCYGLPSPGDEVAQRFEIARSAKLIAQYADSWPTYIRFPGLCQDPGDVALAGEYGEYTVGTDLTIFDTGVTDASFAVEGILAEVQPGSIILLHLNGAPNTPATLEILTQLVPALRERGLTPVTVSELLAPVDQEPAPADPTAEPAEVG